MSSNIPAAIAGRDHEEIRAAIVAELIPIIPANVDPQTWDPRELESSGGNVWQAVAWQERFWWRDDTSTADHDEITCIILADGGHYLTNDVRFPGWVWSRTVTAPPEPDDSPPPEYGDTWLVPDGATGEWATHEQQRAMWTARGWQYEARRIGELVYVRDPLDTGFIHVNLDDEWENGTGPRELPDASVQPRHLQIRFWNVENSTTTAPPASGPAGEQYIIGASATGAWAGHDRKLAYRPATNAAFVIVAPLVGERAFNKATGIWLRWNGSAWVTDVGAWIEVAAQVTAANTSTTNVTAGMSNYVYSASTAPTTNTRRRTDDVTITHTAKGAGANKLRFHYECDVELVVSGTTLGTGDCCIALYRDSEANAIAWCRAGHRLDGSFLDDAGANYQLHLSATFIVDSPNASSHVYKIALTEIASTHAADFNAMTRRQFTLEEKS